MKISIITVCFNAQDTIEETLMSIASQSYKNIEHIVVDGASTDKTIEIINKYKNNIVHLVSEHDNGVYDAMNKGIKLATGDFLFFLNANDILYDNDVLKNVVDALNKKPEAKFLFGDVDNVSEDKKTSTIRQYNNINNDFYFLNDNICHQSIFYHKSLFEELGYYSNKFKIYADWDFNIKCLVKNKVNALYIPIPISKFQFGGLCTDSNNRNIFKKENNLLIEKHYSKYKFFISIDNFLMKNFKAIYKSFRESLILNNILKSFTSKKKFALNILNANT